MQWLGFGKKPQPALEPKAPEGRPEAPEKPTFKEPYNWNNVLTDFPIGQNVRYYKYMVNPTGGQKRIEKEGEVIGFNIIVNIPNSNDFEDMNERIHKENIDPTDVIIDRRPSPQDTYQLQTGPDGNKVSVINGIPVNLTPKVGGRRKTKSKSRKGKSKSKKSRKSRN